MDPSAPFPVRGASIGATSPRMQEQQEHGAGQVVPDLDERFLAGPPAIPLPALPQLPPPSSLKSSARFSGAAAARPSSSASTGTQTRFQWIDLGEFKRCVSACFKLNIVLWQTRSQPPSLPSCLQARPLQLARPLPRETAARCFILCPRWSTPMYPMCHCRTCLQLAVLRSQEPVAHRLSTRWDNYRESVKPAHRCSGVIALDSTIHLAQTATILHLLCRYTRQGCSSNILKTTRSRRNSGSTTIHRPVQACHLTLPHTLRPSKLQVYRCRPHLSPRTFQIRLTTGPPRASAQQDQIQRTAAPSSQTMAAIASARQAVHVELYTLLERQVR